MTFIALYRKRDLGYDQDWLDAFKRGGFQLHNIEQKEVDGDGYVLLHSLFGQGIYVPDWLEKKKVNKVCLLVNEFSLINKRREAIRRIGGIVATQGTKEDGQKLYGECISIPHALNPSYREVVKRCDRKISMGYRGNPYSGRTGDEDRESIVKLFSGFENSDVKIGKDTFLGKGWMMFLNSIKSIPTTEAGATYLKCLSPRHMEAIGTKTIQVSYPGRYSGVLRPRHYITLERDHSNLEEVKRMLSDEGLCEEITTEAREEMLAFHTYDHRVKKITEILSGD